jgi:hypothetical protein
VVEKQSKMICLRFVLRGSKMEGAQETHNDSFSF